ncbi:MAG: LysM peptidoglycan-binding domain-containing protein [Bacillus sp. (in: firmicutes)]
MKKTILSLIAMAAISTSAGMSAEAAEVVVNKGETLSSLSKEHGVTVEDIKEWNGLTSDLIYENQAITVSAPAERSGETYKVVPGDTLWDIASKYGVTIGELQLWNDISGHLIYPEQTLMIQPGKAAAPAKTNATTDKKQSQPRTEQTAQSETPKQAVKQEASSNVKEEASKPAAAAKTIEMTATAYTAYCSGCSGVTASGMDLRANPDAKVIAVDPSVIPLGTKVYVEGYGYAVAADTGGAIKGNKIDVFTPSKDDALQWGRRTVEVQILQ